MISGRMSEYLVVRSQGEEIRKKAIENDLAKVEVSVQNALEKIKELMEARENKIIYDVKNCEWKISPPLAALNIQLQATNLTLSLIGAYASEKFNVRHSIAPDLETKLTRASKV